ncbi:MAG TPA: LptF/LptG family permease, partial [Planctomycetota bacterium]|nr:LptF/LptG family permease [Planctomycetota bacterium]
FRSRNLFVSLAASFGICALFYLLSSISMSIGNQSEILRPILAAWLPVLLFGSLGITLLDNVPT